MITDERLKELMISVGMPDSKSLYQALKQCDMEAELRASEELETLRAENASIKENLTIAYMDGYAKAQDRIRGLESENAKLIAERDSTMLTICALRAEIDEYQAEREAMMKQEPVATVSGWVGARAAKDQISLIVDVPAGFTFLRGQKLYANPLPAQQPV